MKNYFKHLKTELESRAPQMSNEVKQTTIVTQQKRKSPFASLFNSWQRVAAFCVALVLVVGVGVLGTAHLTNNSYQANATYVSLSINPSFSLVLDSNDKVVRVVATNYDGEVVLTDQLATQLLGKSADQAASTLVEQAIALGYAGDGVVNVTAVSSKGEDKAQKVLDKISHTASQTLQNLGSASVVETAKQTLEQLQQTAEYYFGEHGKTDVKGLIETMSQVPGYLERLQSLPQDQFEKEMESYNLQSKLSAIRKHLADLHAKNVVLQQVDWATVDALYTQLTNQILLNPSLWGKDPIGMLFDSRQDLSQEIQQLLDSLQANLQPVIDNDIKFDTYGGLLATKQSYQRVEEMLQKLHQIDGYIVEGNSIVQGLIDGLVDEICFWLESAVEDASGVMEEINSSITASNPHDFANSVKDKIDRERNNRKEQHGNGATNQGGHGQHGGKR